MKEKVRTPSASARRARSHTPTAIRSGPPAQSKRQQWKSRSMGRPPSSRCAGAASLCRTFEHDEPALGRHDDVTAGRRAARVAEPEDHLTRTARHEVVGSEEDVGDARANDVDVEAPPLELERG